MHYDRSPQFASVAIGPSASPQSTVVGDAHHLSVLGILQRHRIYVLACVVASAGAGYLLSERFSSLRWTYESTLLYSRPAAITSYTPPDPDSLAKLIKSHSLLTKLSAAFDGEFSPERLDRALTVSPPYGSCLVTLSLVWSEQQQGARILDKLVELFQEHVRQQREKSLDHVAAGLRASQQHCAAALEAARKVEADFTGSEGVADVDDEMSTVRRVIANLERDLVDVQADHTAAEAKYRSAANPNNAQLPQLIEAATITTREKASQLETLLAARRADYQRLVALHKAVQQLTENIDSLGRERQRLAGELSIVGQLAADKTSGFTVVHPATEALHSPTSNRHKMFFGFSVLICLALCAPVFIVEFARNRESALVGWARSLGLPILVRLAAHRVATDDSFAGAGFGYDALRLLAMRIRQAMEQPAGAVLFCGMNRAPTPERLLFGLAHCLSEHGERVLLLWLGNTTTPERQLEPAVGSSRALGQKPRQLASRARGNGATALAKASDLAACLSLDPDGVEQWIQATDLPGVDELRATDDEFPREAWGTQRMTGLLSELQERYSMVLVSGPTLAQPVDLQLLAAHVGGIVFSVPDGFRANGNTSAVVRDLMRSQAPILGMIS